MDDTISNFSHSASVCSTTSKSRHAKKICAYCGKIERPNWVKHCLEIDPVTKEQHNPRKELWFEENDVPLLGVAWCDNWQGMIINESGLPLNSIAKY